MGSGIYIFEILQKVQILWNTTRDALSVDMEKDPKNIIGRMYS